MKAKNYKYEDIIWVEVVEVGGVAGWEEWHLLVHLHRGGSFFPDPPIHFSSARGALNAILVRWGHGALLDTLSRQQLDNKWLWG